MWVRQMKELNKKRETNIASIVKALQVLECFSIATPVLTAADISKMVDMPTSTLYRYLQTLVDEGYLKHNTQTNSYSVGLFVIQLAGIALSQFPVLKAGQQELHDLSLKLRMAVNLSILDDGDVFHLAYSTHLPSNPNYNIVGRRTPAYLTAMGKMMLAYLPFEEVRRQIERTGWRPMTPNSIRDFDVLKAQLIEARKNQFATDIHENGNTCCLACPIRRENGDVVAAISASTMNLMSDEAFEENREFIRKNVFASAAAISYRMGYQGGAYKEL